jgi:hypothetical protein
MKTLTLVFLLACHLTLMAQTEITSQGTTYKLPDIGELKSPEALKSAAATAQMAAGALTAESAGLSASAKAAETEINNLGDKVKDYRGKLDSYNKNTLGPYTEDLNRYKLNLDKYSGLVNTYNSEVAASDALPANQRDPNKIANLNGRKVGLDDWKGKLDTWKGTLDVKKAAADQELQMLNDIRQGLLPQYTAGKQKLSDLQARLKLAYQQLLDCKAYADKCKATLKAQYPTYTGIATTGALGTKVWSGTIADLQTSMERLKALSGKVFDGN